MKYFTIYEITNLVNGKTYIGKHETDDPHDEYLGSGRNIRRAIEKYGVECFYKHILFVFDNESDMNSKEKELVTEEFVRLSTNYNLCPGGHGGFGYINSNGLWDRDKSSAACLEQRQKLHQDHRTKLKENDDYLNALLSRAKLGRENQKSLYPDGLWHGKKHSTETKQKMSLAASKRTGEKNSSFGTCWVTNEIENKKIPLLDLSDWIRVGYRRGRKL